MGHPKELTEEERRLLISQGYKPLEVWVPDMSNPEILARAEAEARRIAVADREECAQWRS
jgi:hypothetical protein